jgi:hypothetical protein
MPVSADNLPVEEPPAASNARPPLRAVLAVIAAWVCLVGFYGENPWWSRDGIWLMHLVEALPWFILAPGFAAYASIVPHGSRGLRVLAIATLIVFLCLPLTWDFAARLFTQLIPLIPVSG